MTKNVTIILDQNISKLKIEDSTINFCGLPLLAWSIIQANSANCVSSVYVSSSSSECLELAEKFGAKKILRPLSLESASISALIHAVEFIEHTEGELNENVVCLRAMSPLREASDIEDAYALYESSNVDALFSGMEVDGNQVWSGSFDELSSFKDKLLNRSIENAVVNHYVENGSIYIVKSKQLLEQKNLLSGKIVAYNMPFWKSYEIDSADKLEFCEYYFRRKLLASQLNNHLFLEKIKLIIYDFDGVMTDNKVTLDQNGLELVTVNRSDGLGVGILKGIGIKQMILSTETNSVVSARAKKLDLPVIQSCNDKLKALEQVCSLNKLSLDQVLYVGNDINDLEAMKIVGCPVCPADAHPDVVAISRYRTISNGGEGVVREIAELFLNSNIKERSLCQTTFAV